MRIQTLFFAELLTRDPLSFPTDTDDWLNLFGLKLGALFGAERASEFRPTSSPCRPPELALAVGLIDQRRAAAESLLDPGLASRGLLASEGVTLPRLFSRVAARPPAFGKGLLLTDLNGRAVLTVADEGVPGDVVQSVFLSVLNASHVLDLSHAGREEYFFFKPELSSFQTDLGELQRLSGTYNVSHDGVR